MSRRLITLPAIAVVSCQALAQQSSNPGATAVGTILAFLFLIALIAVPVWLIWVIIRKRRTVIQEKKVKLEQRNIEAQERAADALAHRERMARVQAEAAALQASNDRFAADHQATPAGRYASGHPDLPNESDGTYLGTTSSDLEIILPMPHELRVAATIPLGAIANVKKRDATTTRSIVTIIWKDNGFSYDTIFEFTGSTAANQANALKTQITKLLSLSRSDLSAI